MKLNKPIKSEAGSAQVIAIVMLSLVGMALASYLTMVSNQNRSVMRSLAWNSSMALVEAGVEEGITHVNVAGLKNLASNGWMLSDGDYTKRRALGDGYFVVRISLVDPPVITAEGFARAPMNSTYQPLALLATLGVNLDVTEENSGYVSRTVRVTTRRDSLWSKAMVAKGRIDLNGNNVQSDSFDSGDPLWSTGGRYDPAKFRDKGDVASNLTLVNSVNVGNANILGRVSTGPGGSVYVGSNGAVGSKAWQQSGNKGIEPGWTTDDMNVYFPDIGIPYSSAWAPSSGTVSGATYTYVLGNGQYRMSGLTMAGHETMYVAGNTTLYITGNVSITGNASIQVAPGARLVIYMGGASANIAGKGVLNQTGNAANFVYLGLPTHTSLSIQGNGEFVGAIYAPNAAFVLGGGGSNSQDFIGSSVTNTVRMNGHFKFHYDEALGRSNWLRGFLINQWSEI